MTPSREHGRTLSESSSPRRVSLREDVVRGAGKLTVDRDQCIIPGVKVLGQQSLNQRIYLPDAIRNALPLYEGCPVRINHPVDAEDSYASEDVFGWLTDIRLVDSGDLYGDLHYLKAHPMAERVCEAAERNAALFGLSHNAQGDGEDNEDGVFVIGEIVEVRSVDLVADPATTKGLFEARTSQRKESMSQATTKKIKLRKFCERFSFDPARKKVIKKLLEDYGEDEVAMGEDGDTMTPEDQLAAGFRAAILAVVDDDSMDADAKISKIKDFLKTQEKLKGSGDDTEDETEDDASEDDTEDETAQEDDADEDETEDDATEDASAAFEDDASEDETEDDATESKKPRFPKNLRGMLLEFKKAHRQLKASHDLLARKDRARDLCEQSGIVPDKVLLEALLSAKDEAAMKRLLARERDRGASRNRPRSSAAFSGIRLKEAADPIEDVEAFIRELRAS